MAALRIVRVEESSKWPSSSSIVKTWACLDSNQGPRDYEFPSRSYNSAVISTFVVDTCSAMLGPSPNRIVYVVRLFRRSCAVPACCLPAVSSTDSFQVARLVFEARKRTTIPALSVRNRTPVAYWSSRLSQCPEVRATRIANDDQIGDFHFGGGSCPGCACLGTAGRSTAQGPARIRRGVLAEAG